MKKEKVALLISGIGLIVFCFNTFFEFIPFVSPKNNLFIIMFLSLLNFIFLVRKLNKEKKTS